MAKLFSEATRVQIPAILHLMRLGYKYLPVVTEYDHKTNILTDVFKECVQNLNPGIAAQEIEILRNDLVRIANNDDLGREFYKKNQRHVGLQNH